MAQTKKTTEGKELATLEQSLTLVVKEQKLGELITNAKEIKEFVSQKLKEYTLENYKGDDKKAAKDKAELNNAIKNLNDERIKLEKAFMKPFDEFKSIVTETCDMIKVASNQLDTIVKAQEEIRKAEKRKEIETYWNSLNCQLIKLDQIFNPKWLNKGAKIGDIKTEIDDKVKEINENLETLGQFGEDSVMLQSLYMSNFDLPSALRKGNELKANRELLAKQEEEKKQKSLEPEKQEVKTTVEPTVQNNKPETPTTPVNNQLNEVNRNGERIITFYVTEQVANIAKTCNLQVVPMEFRGSLADVETFKKRLLQAGYSYEKSTWGTSLGFSLLLIVSKDK